MFEKTDPKEEIEAIEREVFQIAHTMFRSLALQAEEPSNTQVVKAVVNAFHAANRHWDHARELLKAKYGASAPTVSIETAAIVCTAFLHRYDANCEDVPCATRAGAELVSFIRGMQFLSAIQSASGALDRYLGGMDGEHAADRGAQVLDQLIPYPEDEEDEPEQPLGDHPAN